MLLIKIIIKTNIYILQVIVTYENMYCGIALNLMKFQFPFK